MIKIQIQHKLVKICKWQVANQLTFWQNTAEGLNFGETGINSVSVRVLSRSSTTPHSTCIIQLECGANQYTNISGQRCVLI